MDIQIQNYEKYCYKPDIRIRNYYFQWDTGGLGLATRESNHFRNFVRKVIPVLEQYMIFLQNDNNIDRNDPYRDKKQICIRDKYNQKTSFLMFIDSQGSTIFFREESCEVDINPKPQYGYDAYSVDRSRIDSNNSSGNNDHSKVKIDLKWLLGELLFDRVK
ncbi:MAG: hypothetical protein AB7U98_12730 [Candidatus Nitrosocosmicus sp.]